MRESKELGAYILGPDQEVESQNLLSDYYSIQPQPGDTKQRVKFGTAGHRGTSTLGSFNEAHILAIAQAIAEFRQQQGICGPMFVGMDTHGLSSPAQRTVLEVFSAHEIDIYIAPLTGDARYTPTPVISYAILHYNRGKIRHLADGLIITPSHNPPCDGGIKYNSPSGGPAQPIATQWIEARANQLLGNGNREVKRWTYEKALKAPTTHIYDYISGYVRDLCTVVDLKALSTSDIHIGVDPLGGSSVCYWDAIAEHYQLKLDILERTIDPSFYFLAPDWDGKRRMDCSSPEVMANLVKVRDKYDIAFGNDADSDRFGVVTPNAGLIPPNHFLAVAIGYLAQSRSDWSASGVIGKSIVTSDMLNRVARSIGYSLYEAPIGFRWFVPGLQEGSLNFAGEESAGASFQRKDGSVWTTDKDGIVMNLLAAEIFAKSGKDLSRHYQDLTDKYGECYYTKIFVPAKPGQKKKLSQLSEFEISASTLAGDPIVAKFTRAPANDASLGGIKIRTTNGWFVARPSGTEMVEPVYKVYGESFKSEHHLDLLMQEAIQIVNNVTQ
ncbi:MAG: alpha-D-glucose phosphate-specific phosphoglucomutase [Moorea sp. SIO3I7]|uniref:phosphoglucomutase, alpha-D-glucose phosphate-specific n=1 Tax=unclassified Moorena TaxID=2683338 RepID=UPI0013C1C356|nr:MULTISPECIES: phosphoglucomutase, alpha-D-glucose phosphate-specific [unclassified Moorena]NEO00304.1 alpha-D-glucose phosphate-specific phosphoglucomutase [Moorena sp. SIO3I7]NEO05743.1 alpha-D-glucose phosphate-specific phosphoglucomutase [Moorena sp. SIO3I8]NEP25086.1 alpha-D-glucose phosphate-specific phosphoglucomutase [Moorena sp. SIO3I6]NEQ62406.1 alpha-D-glucose phosphate-specific phosphoglucomutase [Moorena sp. SIO4A1]